MEKGNEKLTRGSEKEKKKKSRIERIDSKTILFIFFELVFDPLLFLKSSCFHEVGLLAALPDEELVMPVFAMMR